MKRNNNRRLVMLSILLLVCGRELRAAAKTLDIYFIDVEGGAATLIVTPLGESLLVDSGFPGSVMRPGSRTSRATWRD